jgi:hypothetical protein
MLVIREADGGGRLKWQAQASLQRPLQTPPSAVTERASMAFCISCHLVPIFQPTISIFNH